MSSPARRCLPAAALVVILALATLLSPLATATTKPAGQSGAVLMTNLKSRGDNEIDRRLQVLSTLANVVDESRHLSASDKSQLKDQIQSDQSGLSALKAKIDADTDLPTLRVDLRKIVTDFRVFVLLIPKIHMVRAIDLFQDAAGFLEKATTKLQSLIDTAKGQGKDTAADQTAFDDMLAKISDAKAKLQGLAAELLSLAPSGYPGNRSASMAAREKIRQAKTDLTEARADARKILGDLRP